MFQDLYKFQNLNPCLQKSPEFSGPKIEEPKKPEIKDLPPVKTPEELQHPVDRSRLLKALGISFDSTPTNNEYEATIPNGAGGESDFRFKIIRPGKVEISTISYGPSKSLLGPRTRGHSNFFECKINDLLDGKIDKYPEVVKYLKNQEAENKQRSLNKLVENNSGLEAHIKNAYDSVMEEFFKYPDTQFTKLFKNADEFSQAFNDKLRTFFKPENFSSQIDNLDASANYIRVVYKRGKGLVPGTKVSPSMVLSNEYYDKLKGLYDLKSSEILANLKKNPKAPA